MPTASVRKWEIGEAQALQLAQGVTWRSDLEAKGSPKALGYLHYTQSICSGDSLYCGFSWAGYLPFIAISLIIGGVRETNRHVFNHLVVMFLGLDRIKISDSSR